ncbi:Sec-independent protein translocase protein TATB chloroplastic, partial [Dissostichus eleginoides]
NHTEGESTDNGARGWVERVRSGLPPAESQCLDVTSIQRRPTPGDRAAPSGPSKQDGTQIEG